MVETSRVWTDTDGDGVGDAWVATNDSPNTEPADWLEAIEGQILKDIKSIANAEGWPPDVMRAWYMDISDDFLGYMAGIEASMRGNQTPNRKYWGDSEPEGMGSRIEVYEGALPAGAYMSFYQRGLEWLGRQDPYFGGMLQSWSNNKKKPGGGGGGARGLSRTDFDVNQLTARAEQMWKTYLMADPEHARELAEAYVSARVANPNQALDYDTYVMDRIKKTGRYESLYQNKPPAITEQQYLANYMNTAMQLVRPETANQLTESAAVWGTSQNALVQRARRDRDVQNTPAFITKMEDTLSQVRGVLRG